MNQNIPNTYITMEEANAVDNAVRKARRDGIKVIPIDVDLLDRITWLAYELSKHNTIKDQMLHFMWLRGSRAALNSAIVALKETGAGLIGAEQNETMILALTGMMEKVEEAAKLSGLPDLDSDPSAFQE